MNSTFFLLKKNDIILICFIESFFPSRNLLFWKKITKKGEAEGDGVDKGKKKNRVHWRSLLPEEKAKMVTNIVVRPP